MRNINVLLALIVLALSSSSYGQIEEVKDQVDMGVIDRGHDRILETSFVNTGIQDLTLLRVEGETIYDVRTNMREVPIGERMQIRVKMNPTEKGKRKDIVHFYFSTITYKLTIKSDVQYIDRSSHTPCPDFETPSEKESSDWQAYFKVVDRDTGEALSNATIRLEGKAGTILEFKTDKRGELVAQVPIDFYDIHAVKEGYASFRQENYINKRNNDFRLELMAGERGSVVVWKPSQREKPEPMEEVEESVPSPKPEEEEVIPAAIEIPPSDFALMDYKPNNVVFLIDVSTSMRKENRMALLKSSMIELAEMLRPDDIISIVTYASKTEVILSGKSAGDTERIKDVIEGLEAGGMTAGEAGLKQAYRICDKYFIAGGNNHIYLATDGAFHKGLDKIEALVSSKAEDQMRLSILAIKGDKWAARKMIELSDAGQGAHLSLDEAASEEALKQLIKEQSRR